ncbi:MAG: hypothetical protein WBW81_08115, partial [Methylocella sp.]
LRDREVRGRIEPLGWASNERFGVPVLSLVFAAGKHRPGLHANAGTELAGMGRNARGRPRLARGLALLSTAYGQPVAVHAVAKMRRAAEL